NLAAIGLDDQPRLGVKRAGRGYDCEHSDKNDRHKRRTAKRRAKKLHYSDSGPCEDPPCESREVLSNIQVFKRVRQAATAVPTYTGRDVENRGFWAPNSALMRSEFRRNLSLDSGAFGHRHACALLHHELGACELGKTAAFRNEFIESSAFDHAPVVEHQDA